MIRVLESLARKYHRSVGRVLTTKPIQIGIFTEISMVARKYRVAAKGNLLNLLEEEHDRVLAGQDSSYEWVGRSMDS